MRGRAWKEASRIKNLERRNTEAGAGDSDRVRVAGRSDGFGEVSEVKIEVKGDLRLG